MSYIITDQQITIFGSDGPFTTARADINAENWRKCLEALSDSTYDEAISVISTRAVLDNFFVRSDMKVEVAKDGIRINGEFIDNYPARKAVEFAQQGLPYRPIVRFVEKLRDNPSYRAVQDLYKFLEHSGMPLTDDGDFIAYKKVMRRGGQLVDIHSNTISNNPGDTVWMYRNQVDEDPQRTCSVGLHVCSHEYLPYFGAGGSSAVIAVRVDPADVVAIPIDYNNAKMRVCRYIVDRVLEEWDPSDNINPLGNSLLHDDARRELTSILNNCDVPFDEYHLWHLHDGGERPVDACTDVHVIDEDGCLYKDSEAGDFDIDSDVQWEHEHARSPGDRIVAYRIV